MNQNQAECRWPYSIMHLTEKTIVRQNAFSVVILIDIDSMQTNRQISIREDINYHVNI